MSFVNGCNFYPLPEQLLLVLCETITNASFCKGMLVKLQDSMPSEALSESMSSEDITEIQL